MVVVVVVVVVLLLFVVVAVAAVVANPSSAAGNAVYFSLRLYRAWSQKGNRYVAVQLRLART